MNSDWDMVPHQRNQELFSLEVNGGAIIFRIKRCSHYKEMFGVVSKYLVSMVNTCRPHPPSTCDINIKLPPELYYNHHTTEKRPYQYNKLLHEKSLSLFYPRLYCAFLDTSPSTIKCPCLTPLLLFLEIQYHLVLVFH